MSASDQARWTTELTRRNVTVGMPGPYSFLLWGLFEGEQELQDSIQFSFTPDQLALIMAA